MRLRQQHRQSDRLIFGLCAGIWVFGPTTKHVIERIAVPVFSFIIEQSAASTRINISSASTDISSSAADFGSRGGMVYGHRERLLRP